MANFLFENDYKCWTLDELSNADFENFKSANILNDDYDESIRMFYSKLYDGQHNVPFYHCLPTLNGLIGEKKFKFVVVAVGDDRIFFAYKVIQILKTRQIRFFDIPISLRGNQENVENVIRILACKQYIRFCFIGKHLPLYKNITNRQAQRIVEYDNYYYTRRSFFDRLPTWKLNKYGIRIIADGDFHVTTERIPLHDALRIREDFNRYLSCNGHKISKNDDVAYKLVMSSYCKRIRTLAIYHKKDIIYLRVMMVFEKLGIAYALYDMQARYYDKSDKALDKVLSHNMVEKIKYFTFTSFPLINVVYILGSRPSEHRLLAHKERISDGKVEYFIL